MQESLQPDRAPIEHDGFPTDNRPFVETVFRPDGSVEMRAHGFKGGSCKDALAPYRASIESDIVADTPTSEACATPTRVAAPKGRTTA